MDHLKELKDIFTILHDGSIELLTIKGNEVDLKIEILYLAELIKEDYEFLFLSLKDVESLKFEPWVEDQSVISDWSEVFALGMVIINGELDFSGRLVIHCSCLDSHGFEGGKLVVKCSDYELFDQGYKHITVDRLKKLSSYYWNEKFGRK